MVFKAGVIGCGRIASLLEQDPLREHPCTHAGAYRAVDGVELVAACDLDPERLDNFTAQWGVRRTYLDYAELLAQPDIEVVSVCTWHDSHAEIVLAAAKQPQIKAIICEKPISVNLALARKMVAAAAAHDVKLVVNHERRWQGNYLKVKELLDEGIIGPVRTVIGNVLTGAPTAETWQADFDLCGGGPMLHDGTHLVDIMRYLFGDALWVHGWIESADPGLMVEDTAYGVIMFSSGVKAFLEGGGRRNYFNFELDIQGRDGRILIGNGLLKLWLRDPSSRYSGFYDLVEQPFASFPHQNSYVTMVEELINWQNGGAAGSSRGEDGLAALEIIMALYVSAFSNGKTVSLPLKRPSLAWKKWFRKKQVSP